MQGRDCICEIKAKVFFVCCVQKHRMISLFWGFLKEVDCTEKEKKKKKKIRITTILSNKSSI